MRSSDSTRRIKFFVIPLELREANEFIGRLHRHHKPVQGHRFSIGAVREDTKELVGVCTVGRPVARKTNPKEVLEITRMCTDGTYNACSFLYACAARIGKELGYISIQTFVLDTETGSSLKASGYKLVGKSSGGQWVHTDGKPRRSDQPTCPKNKWSKDLNEAQ